MASLGADNDELIGLYLSRLGIAEPPAPTRDSLDLLVELHLARVPFENIDVYQHRPIPLDTEAVLEKLVRRQRGGFCFEVNEAFRALLAALGYRVRRIEGRVFVEATQAFGAAFDHLALLVEFGGETLLVDVGFGDNNRRPMALPEGRHADISGQYRIAPLPDGEMLLERVGGGAVRPLYRFSLIPRQLADFEPMCAFHQTSPLSIFTKGLICTLPTPTGRITLTQSRLIVLDHGVRTDTAVTDKEHLRGLMWEHFAIAL